MKNFKYILFIPFLIASCQPEFQEEVNQEGFYTSGDADFSNYVSLGNSLTAGYADGALYLQGQQNSYPNIMAGQFALAGGGSFVQPLVNDNLGGLTLSGQQITDNRRVLRIDATGTTPVFLAGTPTTDITQTVTGPINNLGVPGAKSFHLLASGYGNLANFPAAANPYFIRMASSPDATVLADALAQNPSFFSLWIGNNDVLSYATSGGTGVNQTGNVNPLTYGGNDITDPNVFAGSIDAMLQALTANGAKGAIANLPDVTSIPFFTTVPYNAIPLDAQTAAVVNQAYAQYNGGLAQAATFGFIDEEELAQRTIQFAAGQNAVVILDESLTDLTGVNPGLINMRQATADDLILLTTSSVLGTLADPGNPLSVIGVAVPLTDAQVLTTAEVQEISAVQTIYNSTLQALATQYDLALVDTKTMLQQVAEGGIPYDGGVITGAYGTGGGFSLDGVHPTARGYALIANAFINAINTKYKSTVPKVNPGTYPTVFVE